MNYEKPNFEEMELILEGAALLEGSGDFYIPVDGDYE